MPWRPLPRIAFAVATYPFSASSPADLPLEIGDELYIIEQGGHDGSWFRGYLVAPPSLLAGLTCVKGQTLEARVFSGIFPRCCVEVREVLGDPAIDGNAHDTSPNGDGTKDDHANGDSPRRRRSLAHRSSIRRRESSTSFKTNGVVMNGEASKNPGSVKRPTRTSSQRASDHVTGQGLARKLSHRSFTSSQPKSPATPLTPAPEARDPNAKRPQAPVPMLKIGDETPTSLSEPLVDEIASCLREWHSKNLHELLLARRYSVLERVSDLVALLDVARRKLLHDVLTAQELVALREETVWNLVGGNKMLSSEVIVRDPKQYGRLLTGDDSAIEMTKLQSTMSLLDRPPVFQHDPVNLHHLMVELKAFANSGLILPTLTINLCTRCPGESVKALTESYVIDLPSQEDFEKSASAGKFRTLFTDLSSSDIGDASRMGIDLYLIVKIQANQVIQKPPNSPRKTSQNDENASPERPTANKFPSQSSLKGRQSLMWAQKQFGSVRHRNHHDAKTTQALPIPNSSTQENGIRPTTKDGSRPTTQQGTQYVKRSVGVGVVNIKHLFGHGAVGDHQLSIWAPAATMGHTKDSMDDWDELIRDLVTSRNGAYTKCKAFDHVRLTLQSFASPDANELISRTPTLLQNIIQTPKTSFPGAPSKARSDIYVTISEAFLPHQALLSHPERGKVQIPSSLELKNVQLTLEVRKKSGERIEHCIFPGSNTPGQTAWRTSAVGRDEQWNQMIKLVIPQEDVPEAHLIMSIADAPGFPFALSWMPLWTDEAFAKDGSHAPLLYLYDKLTSSSDKGRAAYLAFPWGSRGRDGDTKDDALTGHIATLKLETNLCSTVFSQDTILLGILKWRDQPDAQILDLLRRFAFVPEIEIVKLVGQVFDALFSILVEHAGTDEYEDSVFIAFVTVLGIVHDRRFNLGPFVDWYAETKFDHPYATPCLMRSYLRLLSDPSDPQKSRHVRATFKVGRHILKFIVCAREKLKGKEAGIGTTTQSTFNRDVRRIFHALEAMMKDTSPILVGSKTLVVQHMHTWLPELTAILDEEGILEIAMSFLDSCMEVQGKLILYKLVLILNLLNANLFSQTEVRQKVVRSTPKWINPYWGFNHDESKQWREQVRLCCSIVSKQADEPYLETSEYFVKAVQSYTTLMIPNERRNDNLSLLFPTTYPFPAKPASITAVFDEALTELAGLLARLAVTPFTRQLHQPDSSSADMLFAALEVNKSILSGRAFPKTWLSLYVFHHKSSLQILESLFEVMVTDHIPSPDDADNFNTELWSRYLLTLLTLVRSETLALETFPEQKRRAVWKIAGDVRAAGAELLKRSWDAIGWETSTGEQKKYGLSHLGGFQVQYVPSLVAPVVELCLSVHEGLRNVAVRILQAMIVSEWTLNEDLTVVQAEMIDCLETLFKSKNIGESLVQKMFVNELLDMFESLARIPDDPLWQAIKDMVTTIDELLQLLAAVHSPDITEALRIMNTLQLMNFLKDMQKEDIFIRYVHQLAGVQAQLGNRTEAALALRLHADLYMWEPVIVRPLTDPLYPEQSSFERKEQLYFEMIKYFEEGEAWDSALVSYRELANQYEHYHYDFAKLARTQRSMATIYEAVAKGEWQAHRYFKVIYHGLGFPSSLRGKQFIYEGEPSERQSVFTDRMRQLHPSAQIVPKGDVEDMEGQYLQISPVSPYRDLEHPIYQQLKVAQSIRDYLSSSKPQRFAITSKRHSPTSGVQDQWIEKTLYSTRESFPTILRRSEIVSIDIAHLSPLQTAVERTSRKTSELAGLEKRISNDNESGLTSLTDAILSSVDPSSGVTVAQYRQLLPITPSEDGDEAESSEPNISPLQNSLQIALVDHVSMLKHCLSHYSRLPHLSIQASLSEKLHTTFAPEIALLAPNTTPEIVQYLSSPPRSSAGLPSSADPALINGHTESSHEDSSEPRPRPLSRISFNFLKVSTSSASKANGVASTPSDDGSSSGNLSQAVNTSSHDSVTANTTALPPAEGAGLERPVTAQSGHSGKVKKRLSSLGIGRIGSARDKVKGEVMGGVVEE
ncbi:hypothetical protein MMC28_003933 [Mycoblastus sanguinarius]|nr:hypothetical protein [Mycoblastus sanguinarius]